MPSSAYYRAKAAECAELANLTPDPKTRDTFRLLAADYRDLAILIEQQEQQDKKSAES